MGLRRVEHCRVELADFVVLSLARGIWSDLPVRCGELVLSACIRLVLVIILSIIQEGILTSALQ